MNETKPRLRYGWRYKPEAVNTRETVAGYTWATFQKDTVDAWPWLCKKPQHLACGGTLSNVPGSVQYVAAPEETTPDGHAVQGGKPSELNEFGGHFPGSASMDEEGGSIRFITYRAV